MKTQNNPPLGQICSFIQLWNIFSYLPCRVLGNSNTNAKCTERNLDKQMNGEMETQIHTQIKFWKNHLWFHYTTAYCNKIKCSLIEKKIRTKTTYISSTRISGIKLTQSLGLIVGGYWYSTIKSKGQNITIENCVDSHMMSLKA